VIVAGVGLDKDEAGSEKDYKEIISIAHQTVKKKKIHSPLLM
jgi:hypothetical protein